MGGLSSSHLFFTHRGLVMSRLEFLLAMEAHQEIEREYCWYVKLDKDPKEIISGFIASGFTPLYQRQANIKAPSGAIRVRYEKEDGTEAYTQTVKKYLPKTGDDIPSSKETTFDIDVDVYTAFVSIVGEEMCKIRFKVPYTDKEGSFWEVDIFTDGEFNPVGYAKIDLETSLTIDDDTVVLPISGDVYPASPANKAVTDEINERVKVKV